MVQGSEGCWLGLEILFLKTLKRNGDVSRFLPGKRRKSEILMKNNEREKRFTMHWFWNDRCFPILRANKKIPKINKNTKQDEPQISLIPNKFEFPKRISKEKS